MKHTAKIAFLALVLAACGLAQVLPTSPLAGRWTPGDQFRYEIEASTSYSASTIEGYGTNPPLGPCQYALASIVTLSTGATDAGGNIPVKAEYHDFKVTSWQCAQFNRAQLEKSLKDFAAVPVVYQIGPHGEVGFEHNSRDRFTYQSAADLLSKIALDLLQTHLADQPVAVGASWKPRGQFTYWKDRVLSGLDVSAATMRWKSTPKIAGRDCAWVSSKYVFAPTESSSGPITADGSLRQQPTNVVAGALNVSLLFDLQNRHIAWLDRSYRIENHVSLQPEEAQDPEVLTIRWVEEGKARLIPEKNFVEWAAAIKTFESAPEPGLPVAQPTGTGPSLADLARAAVTRKKPSATEIESLDLTPPGFARWEREFCDSWYCAQISVALPGEVKLADDNSLQSAYLARTPNGVLTITVGPPLERKYQGLTPEEELKKQSEYFLSKQLWMSNQPGISVESEDTSLDGYYARVTTFRGRRRDLASIQGKLAVLLSPWGEAFPVTCSLDQRDSATLEATCDRIIGLIRLHRQDP